MGSFSWIRADMKTQRSNLTYGDRYKILVPKEFGGGYIVDVYYDYGYIFDEDTVDKRCKYVDGNGKVYKHDEFDRGDLYGVLAYWNGCTGMRYSGDTYPSTMYDILKRGCTGVECNRCKGIDIGCYDEQIDRLEYPLKLVSYSYKGTYEDCSMKSYGDPCQGFHKAKWDDWSYRHFCRKQKGWRYGC